MHNLHGPIADRVAFGIVLVDNRGSEDRFDETVEMKKVFMQEGGTQGVHQVT
ncbi:MAG: hypothetical protein LQ349_006863, partial [Xanthoria aureola]